MHRLLAPPGNLWGLAETAEGGKRVSYTRPLRRLCGFDSRQLHCFLKMLRWRNLADAPDSGSGALVVCGFDSRSEHPS